MSPNFPERLREPGRRAVTLILLSLLWLHQPSLAQGQCGYEWKPGEGLPGLDGPVYAMTTWDPDGAGPGSEVLVAGGDFDVAGNSAANNIACWDGSSWQALGSGFTGGVYALAVYNGALVAGGGFTEAGGVSASRIARWNGTAWYPLGTGTNGTVRTLAVYDGELVAGGDFTMAGGSLVSYIARWNGFSWRHLDGGVTYGHVYASVRALTIYNGSLIVGGVFHGGRLCVDSRNRSLEWCLVRAGSGTNPSRRKRACDGQIQ